MDWLRSVRATSWKSKFHAFPFFASRTLHCNAEILFHFHLTSLWKNFIKIIIHFREETSLRASSPGRSGNRAAKGRRTCNSSLEFDICIKIVNAKCRLVKTTLVMTSLPLAHVFKFLVKFVLVSASGWLSDIWQLSWWGATVELEVEFKFQRHHIVLSSPSFSRPVAREPRRACLQAK